MTYIKSNLRKFKWSKRIFLIAATTTRWMLLPLLNILISKWLIEENGEKFWGEFYSNFLSVMLFAHISGYGNRDFLLREFSQSPKNAVHLWQESLWHRSLLLIPMFFFFGWHKTHFAETIFLMGWTISTFLLQSFDSWVVYQKKFNENLLVESAGFILLFSGIYLKIIDNTLTTLYLLYFISTFFKVIAFIFLFRKILFTQIPHLSLNISFHFQKGFLFFLIALGGMLTSRVDIYALKTLVSPQELAHYQVFSNLYLQIQTFAGLIILPFTKNIYRFSQTQILHACAKLFLIGIAVNLFASIPIYLLLSSYYKLFFSWDCYFLASLAGLPIYAYSLLIYRFYKQKKTQIVLFSQFAAILIVLLFTYLFAPIGGMKAALFANVIGQWTLCIFYFWKSMKINI